MLMGLVLMSKPTDHPRYLIRDAGDACGASSLRAQKEDSRQELPRLTTTPQDCQTPSHCLCRCSRRGDHPGHPSLYRKTHHCTGLMHHEALQRLSAIASETDSSPTRYMFQELHISGHTGPSDVRPPRWLETRRQPCGGEACWAAIVDVRNWYWFRCRVKFSTGWMLYR